MRRVCDNALKDICLTSCGDLDTITLKTFLIAANPLSAITTSAVTAFSVRRLSCTYTGFALRVRSTAAGNPTLDIGYTANGDLDTATLKTFVGSNSAFVTIWYDQSASPHNASQATASLQPRIVNTGIIDRQNGWPSVRFLGMGYVLSTSTFTGYPTAACFNSVSKVITDLTYNTIVNKSNINFPAPLDFYNSQGVFGNGTNYTFGSSSQGISAAVPMSIWTYQFSASTFSFNIFYNGTTTCSGAGAFYGDPGNQLTLGGRSDGLTGLNGTISEVITFASLPSTIERQFVEWSQGQYYNISGGPALTTLPALPGSGYLSAWYDQSGNSKTAVQTNTANQPRIVNAGVIDKSGTLPAINFSGYPQNLVAPLSASAYPISLSLLANTSGGITNGAFVKLGNLINSTDGGIAVGVGNASGNFDNIGTSLISLKEWSAWLPSFPDYTYPINTFLSTTIQQAGGTMNTYLNGVNIPLSNSTATVGATISGSLFIGGYPNVLNRYPVVKETEVSVFPLALSATRKALLETNQSAYNNIAIIGSKYLPPTTTSYNRFVNGVGRESATDSVAGTRSSTGMGLSVGSTVNDFLKDNGDYITIGMNCPVTPSTATTNLPTSIVARWNNDWYLNKTDIGANNGIVTVYFDFYDYGVSASPGVAANYELLSRTTPTTNFNIVAGTTKTVTGARVLFTVNASNILTNLYYTIGTKSIAASPLPVELLSFDASCNNNKVTINWSTASQKNNDYFSIERTVDGINFNVVGKTKGAGTSSTLMRYTFIDQQPLAGLSYYRLRQTDFTGENKSFKLVQTSCVGNTNAMTIYPNPNNGSFIIEGASLNTEITILNALGERVDQEIIYSVRQSLDLSNLPNGVYFVKADGQNPVIKKLIIQH